MSDALFLKLDGDMTGRNLMSRKVGNNTYKERHRESTDASSEYIAIRLHETDVLRVYRDGRIVLSSGGWRTVTTKDRINAWLPRPWHLVQNKGTWYLHHGYWNDPNPSSCLFADGMTIHPDGHVSGAFPADEAYERRVAKLKRIVKAYAALYTEHLPLPFPSNGDCWMCLFHNDGGRTWGDLSASGRAQAVGDILGDIDDAKQDADRASSHLVAHIAEGYVVPSLLVNAFNEFGASQMMRWLAFSEDFHASMGERADYGGYLSRDIRKCVYRYIMRRFGFAV